MTRLDLDAIKESIIHRHENLLLDSVSITNPESISGTLTLCIPPNDALDRQLFLKESPTGTLILNTPIYMEILALASIVVSGKLKPGEAAIFAGISNFTSHGHYPAGSLLTGNIKRINAKREFLKYSGELAVNNQIIATGNMTAFFSTINFDDANATTPAINSLPQTCTHNTPKHNRHKPESMIISDTLTHTDPNQNECISTYTYPHTHPLIKGHFPNNPIMMGIMQWMSLEDGLCAYLEHQNLSGQQTWTCDATLYNQHKALISTIKGATLESWINIPNTKNQCEIKATQRITFKNMVKPNDTLHTHITNITPA